MISVGIFAKPPVPGAVKTRLIPDIGADKATRVYRYCLEYTLAVVKQSGLDYQLFVSEVSNDPLFHEEDYSLQKGDDLGARMFHAFQDLLLRGSDGALIIGTDCLDITSMHLQEAARSLSDHELVLIPAWSSDQVFQQTVDNADHLNYRIKSHESIRDIDSLQDLEHYPELLALIASS